MTQNAAYKDGYLILPHSQTNQAVPRVTQFAIREAPIAREEGYIAEFMQQGNDFLVLHSLSSHIRTDLLDWNSPCVQQTLLVFGRFRQEGSRWNRPQDKSRLRA